MLQNSKIRVVRGEAGLILLSMNAASHPGPPRPAGPIKGRDYERIAKAIAYIQDNLSRQPSLERIASHVGLSPWHFQRKFRHWAGISPKRFLECLTVERAKGLIDESATLLDASLELGLSGPGRLHEQFVSIEAMTPGQCKSGGAGLEVVYGFHPGPFGRMLLARTEKGICALSFAEASDQRQVAALRRQWPRARLSEDGAATEADALAVFNPRSNTERKFHLAVRGTNFQVNVWRALLKIPPGRVVSYQQLATQLGRPAAVRAAANAVAANPVAWLIPCHRVLRKTGALGGYRWGLARKESLLAWDAVLAR